MDKAISRMPLFDPAKTRQWLAAVTAGYPCFEIRLLGVYFRNSRRPIRALSGFFDDPAAAVRELERLDLVRCRGMYWTLNPLSEALLARAHNRFATDAPVSGATDQDVVRRHWLLVDIDPRRPADVSATNEEKEGGWRMTEAVLDFLDRLGWPRPGIADSGNGFHLLYRVDLPTNDDELVKRVLIALSDRVQADRAEIDLTVHNPSRICKLYGTLACKGENAVDLGRPWRASQVNDLPDPVVVVSVEQLEALAATVKPTRTHPPGSSYQGTGQPESWTQDDIRELISNQGWTVVREKDKDGRHLWILSACPVCGCEDDPAHVSIAPSGQLGFACKHNRCQGIGWVQLRQDHLQGWRPSRLRDRPASSRPLPEEPHDLAAMDADAGDFNRPPPTEDPRGGAALPYLDDFILYRNQDLQNWPKSLLRPPGIAGEIADLYNQTAEIIRPEFGMITGLAAVSALLARSFYTPPGTHPVLYQMGICTAGQGKNHIRRTLSYILGDLGQHWRLRTGGYASEPGLHQSMMRSPAQIVVIDEFGKWLRASDGKDSHQMLVRKAIMERLGSENMPLEPKEYSSSTRQKEFKLVNRPCLGLLGTTTPTDFMSALTTGNISDGFLPRMLCVIADGPRRLNVDQIIASPPESVRSWWSQIEARSPGDPQDCTTPPTLVEVKVPCSYRRELREQLFARETELAAEFKVFGLDDIALRYREYVMKVALIISLSIDPATESIVEQAVAWAGSMVETSFRQLAESAAGHLADTAFQERKLKILRTLREEGPMTKSSMCRHVRTGAFTAAERAEALAELIDAGLVVQAEHKPPGRGRSSTVWAAILSSKIRAGAKSTAA